MITAVLAHSCAAGPWAHCRMGGPQNCRASRATELRPHTSATYQMRHSTAKLHQGCATAALPACSRAVLACLHARHTALQPQGEHAGKVGVNHAGKVGVNQVKNIILSGLP